MRAGRANAGTATCYCGEKFCQPQLLDFLCHLRQAHGLDVLSAEIADPALFAASVGEYPGPDGS